VHTFVEDDIKRWTEFVEAVGIDKLTTQQ